MCRKGWAKSVCVSVHAQEDLRIPHWQGIHPDNFSCSVAGNPDDWERKQKEVQRGWGKPALISAWGGNALTFSLQVIKDSVNVCVCVSVWGQSVLKSFICFVLCPGKITGLTQHKLYFQTFEVQVVGNAWGKLYSFGSVTAHQVFHNCNYLFMFLKFT